MKEIYFFHILTFDLKSLLSTKSKAALPYLIALLIFSAPTFAQDINFGLIGKKVSQAVEFEKENKSKIYTSDDDIIIPGGMAVPMFYSRPNKGFPNAIIEYYFSEKDSVVRTIEYKWSATYSKEALNKKYQSLFSSLTKLYGIGKPGGENEHYWTIKPQVEITLYGDFTDYPKVMLHAREKDK